MTKIKNKWAKIKVRFGFCIASVAMIALSVFIYFGYPEAWRSNHIINALLISEQILGAISLSAIFIFYKKIPSMPIKQALSKFGSIHYVYMLNMATLTFVKYLMRIIIDVGVKSEEFSFREFIENDVHYGLFSVFASWLIAFIGFFNANKTSITSYSLNIDKPSVRPRLNIMLLSDIHAGAGTYAKTYRNMTNLVNQIKPDIILIAGDVFDETTSDTDVLELKNFAKTLNPEFGTYFVYGNHDLCRPEYTELFEKDMNIHVLNDEMVHIDDIQLIGRPDYKSRHLLPAEMPNAFGINENKPIIILQHRPNEFLELDALGADVVLAGHTHGFNFVQSIMVSLQSDLIQGRKRYKNLNAIVSSGISSWGFHYKFPAKSEIVNVKLTFRERTKNDT